MTERGLSLDHTTIYRWVQKYSPEIYKRSRPYLKQNHAKPISLVVDIIEQYLPYTSEQWMM